MGRKFKPSRRRGANRRAYPSSLWEEFDRTVGFKRERLERGGQLEHPVDVTPYLYALHPDAVVFMGELDRSDPLQDRIWRRLNGEEGLPLDVMPDEAVPHCYPSFFKEAES